MVDVELDARVGASHRAGEDTNVGGVDARGGGDGVYPLAEELERRRLVAVARVEDPARAHAATRRRARDAGRRAGVGVARGGAGDDARAGGTVNARSRAGRRVPDDAGYGRQGKAGGRWRRVRRVVGG